MQHRNRDDESEIKPVRHIDMGLPALEQRAEEHQEIGDPNEGEPDINVPLGLRVFARFGYTQEVAGGGKHDEKLVAPEHEPGEVAKGKARAAGALNDIETGGDQRIAAKGENH